MKKLSKEIISFVVTILISVAIVFGIRHFIAEPVTVDGRSMDYTLQDGERMFMLKLNKIDRFDVVVLPAPTDAKKLYIKRVIGLPGDTIAYQNDQLIINGQTVDEPYLAEKQAETTGNFTEDFTLEQVAGEAVVPEGKAFVMGDNRQNSLDGRAFGFVDLETLTEADFIHWPLNQIGFTEKYQLTENGIEKR